MKEHEVASMKDNDLRLTGEDWYKDNITCFLYIWQNATRICPRQNVGNTTAFHKSVVHIRLTHENYLGQVVGHGKKALSAVAANFYEYNVTWSWHSWLGSHAVARLPQMDQDIYGDLCDGWSVVRTPTSGETGIHYPEL